MTGEALTPPAPHVSSCEGCQQTYNIIDCSKGLNIKKKT